MHYLRLPVFLCILFCIACGQEEMTPVEEEPMVVTDAVEWSFNGKTFQANGDQVNATITDTPDANVKHLHIEATTDENAVLHIYAQHLFGGGIGSCLPIRAYPAVENVDECFDDGFLIICTASALEFIDADGKKFIKHLDSAESSSLSITACDDANQNTSGSFDMPMFMDGQDPVQLEGSFLLVDYQFKTN